MNGWGARCASRLLCPRHNLTNREGAGRPAGGFPFMKTERGMSQGPPIFPLGPGNIGKVKTVSRPDNYPAGKSIGQRRGKHLRNLDQWPAAPNPMKMTPGLLVQRISCHSRHGFSCPVPAPQPTDL